MARWKHLPEELDPRVRQLVTQLRGLKDTGELSMAQLAARTGYSKSSWERYLAGRHLPPRQAVEAFARTCGVDPVRLLALHELAADAWTKTDTRPSPTADPEPKAAPRRRSVWATAAAGALILAAGAVLLTVRPWQSGRPAAAGYACHLSQTDGRWYAGLSRTRSAIVQQGMAGPEVAEVQCLLRRDGFSPGDVDGIFGDLTQRAVRRLQTKNALVVDGVVGPHSWAVLRG